MAASAWAQQQSPEAAAAEAAVRARAQAFFDLQVAKKYRQGEAMVADESKDAYYNGRKFNIDSYTITRIQMAEGNDAAEVTFKAKVTVVVPAIGQTIHTEAVKTTRWKTENGEWVYVVDTDDALNTPFGRLNPQAAAGKPAAESGAIKRPDVAAMMRAVQIEKNSLEMKAGENQTLKLSNSLPGPVDVRVQKFSLAGLDVKIEKTHLEAGEVTSVRFTASDSASGSADVVIEVAPLSTELPVKVTIR